MADKKVFILLINTGTLFTRIIKLFTKRTYNHVSISFNSELTEVYSFGRKDIDNPFSGGFVKENIHQKLFKQADCVIYSLSVTEFQIQKMKNYIDEMQQQKEQYRYNLLGLFGFLFNRPIERKNAYFCSEFVATVLKECQIINFQKSPSLIAPHDIQKISELQFVYEGNLNAYYNNGDDKELNVPVPFRVVEI